MLQLQTDARNWSVALASTPCRGLPQVAHSSSDPREPLTCLGRLPLDGAETSVSR
jgi:hypothetical protein